MLVEIAIFVTISSFCNLLGLLKKRNGLTQGTIVTISFYSYGIASASSVLASFLLAMYNGSQVITDSVSLCTGLFFAIELLLTIGIFNFCKKVR